MDDKRRRANPKAKQHKLVEERKRVKCDEGEIDKVCKTKCICGLDFCQNFLRVHIEEVRGKFYGLDSDGKITFMLTHFEMREDFIESKGQMVVRGWTICTLAFYTILFGMCNSTYYKYKTLHDSGCKVGYHTNKLRNQETKSSYKPI